MNLDKLKNDIEAGNLNHIALESMLATDLDSRFVRVNDMGGTGFFSRIFHYFFGGCTTCTDECSTTCTNGCSNSTSSYGCNPSCTTCSNGGSII